MTFRIIIPIIILLLYLEIITYTAIILSNVKQKVNMVQVSHTFSCNGIEIDIITAWCEDIYRAS